MKQTEGASMTYNIYRKQKFFLILEIQDSTRSIFLRRQFTYFALASIRLHTYDSFLRFILLLLGDTMMLYKKD